MALANAVQGAVLPVQVITWVDEDGNAVDLTGGSIAGKLENRTTGQISAITGSLTPDPDQVNNKGKFTWSYAAGDVAVSGKFNAQFIATFGGGDAKTIVTSWEVYRALDV